VAPHVSRPLAALVRRCLAKDPDERFATAEALIEALDRAAAERAGAASSPPIASAPRAPIAPSSARSAPRVVEAVGQVAAPRAAAPASTASDAGASWTRGWSASEGTAAPRPVRAGRAARASLAALAVVVLCTCAGTGAATLLRRGQLGTAAAADELAADSRVERGSLQSPARSPTPAAEAPVRRATMVSDDGYAVRALVPAPIRAGRPVELLFDVWDPSGAPLTAPAIPVELASLGRPAPAADDGDTALAARSLPETPGRYRLVAVLPAGESALLLELARGGSIHVHFDVAPATP